MGYLMDTPLPQPAADRLAALRDYLAGIHDPAGPLPQVHVSLADRRSPRRPPQTAAARQARRGSVLVHRVECISEACVPLRARRSPLGRVA